MPWGRIFSKKRVGGGGQPFTFFWVSRVFIYIDIPVSHSVTPMGNVTKYLQKLGMGVYDNENQPGVSKKNNPNLGKQRFSTHQLEVKYAVG